MIRVPRIRILVLVLCAMAVGPLPATADEAANILREGFYTEITDTEAISFTIETFRISGDGSKVVYFGWDGANHQLWVVDGDGQNNTLIETSFELWSLYYGLYDISDDGSTIVYLRLSSSGDPTPEVTRYDVATGMKTTLLKQVSVDYYGDQLIWDIEPLNSDSKHRLSGDGSKFFFINDWGPFNGSPLWSGPTIYSVNTDGSGYAVVFESREIPDIPGIGGDSIYMSLWSGELAVDGDGSLLALPMSSSFPAQDTDLVVMNGDGSNPVVIQDVRGGSFYGPSLDAAGAKVAYARGGTGAAETTGTFVTTSTLPQNPIQVDPASGYWSMYPHIASDASAVVYNFDLGGGSSSSIRWADTSGLQRLPLTHPIVEQKTAKAMVAAGGSTIFTIASTSRLGYAEIVRIDLGGTPPAGHPRVTAVSGSPDMSIGLNDGAYTFFYTTSGSNLREMYSFPFTDDPGYLYFSGFSGFNNNGYLYDDGSSDGDVTAGDGVFTDGAVYLSDIPPVDFFTVRAGVATDDGTAAFADYLCAFGDSYGGIFSDGFESGDTSAWDAAVH